MNTNRKALAVVAAASLLLEGCAASNDRANVPSAARTRLTSGAVGARAQDLSLVARFPEFDADDSFVLERIAYAFTRIDRSMLVEWRPGPSTAARSVRWQPAPRDRDRDDVEDDDGVDATNGRSCPAGRALSRYGAMVTMKSGVGKTRLDVARCGPARGLAFNAPAPAPGVIWNVEGSRVVFVTLDGGRYLVDPSLLEPSAGVSAAAGEPTAARDAVLSEADVRALAQRGLLHGTWSRDLAAAGAAWSRCSAPLWAQALQEYEANDARIADTATKDRQSRDITATYSFVVDEVCAGERIQYERVLASAIAAREATRKRLFEPVLARWTVP